MNCHVGCDFATAIVPALKLRGINLSSETGTKKHSIDYIYFNAENKPVYKQTRIFPKDFRTYRYEQGKWISGIGKIDRLLYHLPELRAAIARGNRVAIAEGEKDADRVIKETDGAVVCTTNLGGASQWRDEYTKEFVNADVTIFYDNDDPGVQKRDRLVATLTPVVKKLTVITLPETYKDISDFWDAGQEITDAMRGAIHIPSLNDFVKNASDWLYELIKEPDELIKGVINAGDKTVIIGKSKTKKSFFSLQLLLSLATGIDFLGFKVRCPRKCLLIQYEIKADNFHIRLVDMAISLNVSAEQVGDNLKIINARGKDIDDAKIIEYAKQEKIEVILFDPLYKMIDGDESDVEVVKQLLKRFDKMAEETKAAIIYVHHDKKGSAGDVAAVDRGSGSGVLGRDYDSALLLTPHKDKTLIGLEVVARNHAPTEGQSIEWQQGCFIQNSAPLQVLTSRAALSGRNKTVIEDWIEPAKAILNSGPVRIPVFLERLNQAGCGVNLARAVRDYLMDSGSTEIDLVPNTQGPPKKMIRLINNINDL